jgi:hypothetical protein
MLIRYENLDHDLKPKGKTQCHFSCDVCNSEFKRMYASQVVMSKSPLYDRDYCQKCWRGILNNRTEYKEKLKSRMSQVCSDPEWKKRNSESKKGKINVGDSNGMKGEEARAKASRSRKKMLENPEMRKLISEKTKNAWAEGKFEYVKVGKCKWHTHIKPNGESCKLQGTWELAFAKWMDENEIQYSSHKGRLKYYEDGKERFYYPDFQVGENDFVEIKSDYFLSLQPLKISLVIENNPGVKIELLTKNLLLEKGIKL